ncbi:MAG: sigma-54-dependent Fis family transcriptional regulator [Treponema sp.]|nr:sigma-54-dependent Fis family transcriptional regulator [Treponema sp.]
MKFTILIIDDEKNLREGIAADFEMDGYNVKLASNGKEGLSLIEQGGIDLVITDLRMPGSVSGEDVLRHVTTEQPGIPVIVLTGHGSIDAAVNAMQNGAFNFLTKPLNLAQLEMNVKRALEGRELRLNHQSLLKQVEETKSAAIIGKSAAMQNVMKLIQKVANSKVSVLVTGESGVGKEVVADTLHKLSSRRDKPMIKVHCAALSESLLESELFGHEKGAFTGADTMHRGKFELAHGGTIFLDEIGEINMSTQVKLLRVLQERQFERVGGEETIDVDVRVIAATNRNLGEEVKAGRFREDLYFRLNGVELVIPPLRERKDDIPLLAREFLARYSKENEKNVTGFSPAARNAVYGYDWPGNIRELQHCVEVAVVMAGGEEIQLDDLPPSVSKNSKSKTISIPMGIPISEAEKIIIQENLNFNNGNKSKTADILGIGRKTLHRKLQEYGLEGDAETGGEEYE